MYTKEKTLYICIHIHIYIYIYPQVLLLAGNVKHTDYKLYIYIHTQTHTYI